MARLRHDEHGFGLVELVIAMSVLSIGVMAVAAAFTSGTVALRRAGETSTASAIAERQLERYRALRYVDIVLDQATVPASGSYWTGFSGALVTAASCPVGAPAAACAASRVLPAAESPNGKPYRVDTYIVQESPATAAAGDSRPLKVVTVVVRAAGNASKILVRQQSTFDEALG